MEAQIHDYLSILENSPRRADRQLADSIARDACRTAAEIAALHAMLAKRLAALGVPIT